VIGTEHLDLLFETADDLPKNAARGVTHAEVLTLCVAQAITAIASDQRFPAAAGTGPAHLFVDLAQQPGYFNAAAREETAPQAAGAAPVAAIGGEGS
jgi:hypothetical protein